MTTEDKTHKLTRLLHEAAAGKTGAKDEVLHLVYDHLRAIARRRMAGERKDHTLQATDLVHEAYLRLVGGDGEGRKFPSRAAFFHAAAEAMRRILIDHARQKGAVKRGGSRRRKLIDVADLAARQDPEEIIALDEAIRRLEAWDPRVGELVRLRFFAGLSVEETAHAMDISPRTVRRDWGFACAWRFRALNEEGSPEPQAQPPA
jgi:RNA polymerase sigma factor (TIGR02999 family)